MNTSENKIIVSCSSCHKKFGLKSDKYLGKKIKCPGCGNPIIVHSQPVEPQNPENQAKGSLFGKAVKVAAVLIVFYFLYSSSFIQNWISGIESGKAIKLDPEKQKYEEYLADCLIDSLDVKDGEKKEINNIVKVMSGNSAPEILPKPEISTEQQRTSNVDAKAGHYRMKKLLQKTKDKGNLHVRISEEEKIDDTLNAFCWKHEEVYRKLWIKAVLHKITQKPDKIDVLKLLDDLCYMRQTNFQKHPGLEAIISFAFKKTMDMDCSVKSDFIEKICCLHYLQNKTEEKKCIRDILDKKIPFGNLEQRGKGYRLLMKYIVLKGGGVDKKLLKFAHKYSQDIAILLEADGCLPQIDGIDKRINLRESVYWASRLFNRDDFRFIAFGGLRMPEAYPPSVCSVYLPELSKCVMRSTWNICYHIKKEMRREYGDDQASLSMDLTTGDISIFGYNHPQCIISNEGYGILDASKTSWNSSKDRDHLHVETSSRVMDIYFIKKFNTWIIKDRILSGESSQNIYFYRSEIEAIDKNTLLSEHYVRLTWAQDVQMGNKQAGNVYLKSSSSFDCKQTKPELEGCYYMASRKLNGETELIITAMPFFCPSKYKYCTNQQFIRRSIRFPLVKKISDTDYACFSMKRYDFHRNFKKEEIRDAKHVFSLAKKLAKND